MFWEATLIILDKPKEYFFDELQKAQRKHSIYLPKDLEYYLAQLLSSFAYAKPYQANAPNIFETPLALVHQKALESKLMKVSNYIDNLEIRVFMSADFSRKV